MENLRVLWYIQFWFWYLFLPCCTLVTPDRQLKICAAKCSLQTRHVRFVQRTIVQHSLCFIPLNVRRFRFWIWLLFVKILHEMQRWLKRQSPLKTRILFSILIFASSSGTFRSLTYCQTLFEVDYSQRPSFQIFDQTIFSKDREWNAEVVNMPITIQNSKFVRHSVDCILDRYVSFDDLLSNFVRGWLFSTSVVSDFWSDYFW